MKRITLVVACFLCSFGSALAQNPAPLVNLPLVPSAAVPGSGGFTLMVSGTGFVSGATVTWNDMPLETTFISSSKLSALVPAADLATPNTAAVAVVNPNSSLRSNVAYFPVASPSSNVLLANAQGSPEYLGANGNYPNMPESMVSADFNGDGKPDLAMITDEAHNPAYLNILLGNGDGTFTTVGSPMQFAQEPSALVVGDFNGDGKLDLAFAEGTELGVLLGNGDGTFSPAPASPNVSGAPLAIGDFNLDGKLDLVAAVSGGVAILLGNGDGTFSAGPGAVLDSGMNFLAATVGDFNGDGKLDLVVGNDVALGSPQTLAVYLGNGDGTFTPAAQTTEVNARPYAFVTGDFNRDGKLDLAVADLTSSVATILLGNGDGTFTPVAACCGTSVPFASSTAIVTGDFNGDGKPDLILDIDEDGPFDYLSILLGNGDGTFTQSDASFSMAEDPITLAVGDFNNDGRLDLASASQPYNYLSVLLQNPSLPPPDFSVAAPASILLQAGQNVDAQVNITSLGEYSGYISVSCSGAPSEAGCSTSATSFFLVASTVGTINFDIATTAPSTSSAAPPKIDSPPIYRLPLLCWLLVIFSGGVALRRVSVPLGPVKAAVAAVVLLCLVFSSSCGSGGSTSGGRTGGNEGTPKGTYTLTVTAAAGTISHSTNITLTVQ
jgi:FG-GAP-like repeat/IPT/TIG domain